MLLRAGQEAAIYGPDVKRPRHVGAAKSREETPNWALTAGQDPCQRPRPSVRQAVGAVAADGLACLLCIAKFLCCGAIVPALETL